MQKRAGLLYLCKSTQRILLILESEKWTVPTFIRQDSLLADAEKILASYSSGKIVPIELYLSHDNGFEYGTYICLVDKEFEAPSLVSYSWCCLNQLPKNLHVGLKSTLSNHIIKTKIETILELENATNQKS
jgi:hypothetical protein